VRRLLAVFGWTLGIIVSLSVGAASVAQFGLQPKVRSEIEKDLRAIYAPEGSTSVKLNSTFFAIDIARGQIESIEAELEGVDTARAATAADRFLAPVLFERVSFFLEHVEFERARVLGGAYSFRARQGVVEAVISERELTRYLQAQGYPVTVTISPAEISETTIARTDTGQLFAISGSARLEISGTMLAFTPVRVDQKGIEVATARKALEMLVPVPSIAGIRPTSVEPAIGGLVLRAPTQAFFGELEDSSGKPLEAEAGRGGAGNTTPVSPDSSPRQAPSPSPSPTRTRTTSSPTPTKATAPPAKTASPTPTRRS
jgi:hypothetical protein